jgi:hypothetical protein
MLVGILSEGSKNMKGQSHIHSVRALHGDCPFNTRSRGSLYLWADPSAGRFGKLRRVPIRFEPWRYRSRGYVAKAAVPCPTPSLSAQFHKGTPRRYVWLVNAIEEGRRPGANLLTRLNWGGLVAPDRDRRGWPRGPWQIDRYWKTIV